MFDQARHCILDRLPGTARATFLAAGFGGLAIGIGGGLAQGQGLRHLGEARQRQRDTGDVRLLHHVERGTLVGQSAPYVGQRRVAELQQTVVRLLQCERGEIRITGELQLCVCNLHVVLGLGDQVGIARVNRDTLQRRHISFEAGHARRQRVE